MAIQAVDHINIVTHRLEETRDFFLRVMGLTEGFRPAFESEGYWFYAGDRAVVHIQQAARPVGPSEASALNHFAFRVTDFDGMLARLDRHGVAYEPMTVPGTAIRQAFLHDPNGVRLELSFIPD